MKGTGASVAAYTVATDHLTGSNAVSTSTGALEELMDYYPYGSPRLDEKAGSFNEKRKFAGHEYDGETGLSYMVARYYDGGVGRFMGQDKLFWSMPFEYLVDPQQQNSYSYARNNPMRYVDPTGMAIETVVDILVLALSYKDFADNRTWWNGLMLGLDALGASVPVVPSAVGCVRHGARATKIGAYFFKVTGSVTEATKLAKSYLDNLFFNFGRKAWSKGTAGDSLGNFIGHFYKHGTEVGAKNVDEYYSMANNLVDSVDNKNIYKFPDPNKPTDDIVFNPSNNQVVVQNNKEGIRTYHVEGNQNKLGQYQTEVQKIKAKQTAESGKK